MCPVAMWLSLVQLNLAGSHPCLCPPCARRGRCSNIHFFLLLATDSARLVPLHWNIITGVFLRRCVRQRVCVRTTMLAAA